MENDRDISKEADIEKKDSELEDKIRELMDESDPVVQKKKGRNRSG